jgi:hypothetical protein
LEPTEMKHTNLIFSELSGLITAKRPCLPG